MVINYTVRKANVGDRFKERTQKKLDKFDRFFDSPTAHVTLSQEGERFTTEITIHTPKMVFRSERTDYDMFISLDQAVDTIFRQITKNKTKLDKNLRKDAFDPKTFDIENFIIDDEESYSENSDEESFKIVRNKRFPIKPSTIEEAILQMNMIGHQFYLFRNGETDEVNLIYKRKDGDYGLIEPEA